MRAMAAPISLVFVAIAWGSELRTSNSGGSELRTADSGSELRTWSDVGYDFVNAIQTWNYNGCSESCFNSLMASVMQKVTKFDNDLKKTGKQMGNEWDKETKPIDKDAVVAVGKLKAGRKKSMKRLQLQGRKVSTKLSQVET